MKTIDIYDMMKITNLRGKDYGKVKKFLDKGRDGRAACSMCKGTNLRTEFLIDAQKRFTGIVSYTITCRDYGKTVKKKL